MSLSDPVVKRDDFSCFGLYLVLTHPRTSYEHCTAAAVEGGVRLVQLRIKDRPRSAVLEIARRLRALTDGTTTQLIVNDDPDVAAEAGADGAHVGQGDEPLDVARRRLPVLRTWGLSTHTVEQAVAACRLSPSYIGAGPVFPTPTKVTPDPVVGLSNLRAIVKAAAPVPVVAIGGIDAGNLRQVLETGARNFAVVRAVCQAADPARAIRELQQVWLETGYAA